MENLRAKKGFICDMDGVIYHGNQLLPGVKEFVEWLQKEEKQFLFLTKQAVALPKEYRINYIVWDWILGRNIFTQVH